MGVAIYNLISFPSISRCLLSPTPSTLHFFVCFLLCTFFLLLFVASHTELLKLAPFVVVLSSLLCEILSYSKGSGDEEEGRGGGWLSTFLSVFIIVA